MKAKLISAVIFLFLASFGLTAKAEVEIDVSTCNTVFLAHMPFGGHAYGLFCPSEGPNYIGGVMTMNNWSPCDFSLGPRDERANESCDSLRMWRVSLERHG